MTKTIKEEKIRAALYLRVSTFEQTKENHYGLKIQREKGEAYCKFREYSLDEKHIYSDKGFSGSLSVEKRPALSQLFEDAKDKEFDVIVVYKIDRMARNLRVFKNTLYDLEKLKIKFQSITESFDTSTPFGRASMNLMSTFAELERDVITERMQNGRRSAAKDGKWVWGPPPYGYKLNPKTKKLEEVKKESKWVKKFFKWVIEEQLPLATIQKRANETGVPCYGKRKRKKKELEGFWHRKTLCKILTNPIYTGTAYFYRFKKEKSLTSLIDKDLQYDEENWITMKVPRIVTEKRFEMCKQQLVRNREMAKRNLKNSYLFNKLVYCGKCGKKLFAGTKNPKKDTKQNLHKFYHGARNAKWRRVLCKDSRCDYCGSVGEVRLEPVWKITEDLLRKPEFMLKKLRTYTKKSSSDKITQKQLDTAEKNYRVVFEGRKRLDLVYRESNTMSSERYRKLLLENKQQERDTLKEIKRLKQRLSFKEGEGDVDEVLNVLHEKLQKNLDNISYKEKSAIIHLLVNKIIVHKESEKVDVEFLIPSLKFVKSLCLSGNKGNLGVLQGRGFYSN